MTQDNKQQGKVEHLGYLLQLERTTPSAEQAAAVIKKTLTRVPEDDGSSLMRSIRGSYFTNLTRLALISGNFEAASTYLHQAEDAGKGPDVWAAYGNHFADLFFTGDVEVPQGTEKPLDTRATAVAGFQRVADLDPIRGNLLLGRFYTETGEFDAAETALNQAWSKAQATEAHPAYIAEIASDLTALVDKSHPAVSFLEKGDHSKD